MGSSNRPVFTNGKRCGRLFVIERWRKDASITSEVISHTNLFGPRLDLFFNESSKTFWQPLFTPVFRANKQTKPRMRDLMCQTHPHAGISREKGLGQKHQVGTKREAKYKTRNVVKVSKNVHKKRSAIQIWMALFTLETDNPSGRITRPIHFPCPCLTRIIRLQNPST